MSHVTFPCPFCNKRMAVGADMLGKKVRCPSCKQVVLAPTEGATAAPAAPPPAAAVAPTDDLPAFTFQRREGADSILSEAQESEDEVFGSTPGSRLERPSFSPPFAPAPLPVPVPTPAADGNPFEFGAAPPEPPPPPPPPPPSVKKKPAAPRVAVVIEDEPPAADPTNPFSDFEAPTASPPVVAATPLPPPPPPAVKPVKVAVVEDEEKPAPPARRPEPAAKRTAPAEGGGLGAPFYLLLLYAVIMTGLALYGFVFRYGTQIDPGHPLSAIPDNFGEFPPSERRKQGQLKKLPDAPLPPELRVAVGKKLDVGPLEVTPAKVEVRKLQVVTVAKGGKAGESTRPDAVVLTLRVRNTSSDVSLHPLDPAFTRKYGGSTDEPLPGTALEVGKEKFRGGALPWPPSERVAAEYEAAQKDDATPLKPGESREYVVFTAPEARIVKAVKDAPEPMLWRVQVRRGFVQLRGKDVPVTAIIGVEFRAADVQLTD